MACPPTNIGDRGVRVTAHAISVLLCGEGDSRDASGGLAAFSWNQAMRKDASSGMGETIGGGRCVAGESESSYPFVG